MTLGNHEFNWGIKNMKTILGQAEFPVLGANILDSEDHFVTGAGWTMVERDGVKFAIIGVCTPDIPIWDGGKEGIAETVFQAANVAVKNAIAEINGQADVIVVSVHMGLNSEFNDPTGADAASKILEDNPEVDVLQVAHTHTTVNEERNGVVIGGVKNAAAQIARFDLTLDKNNKITDAKVEIVDMKDVEPSAELRAIPVVARMHQETIDFVYKEVLSTSTAKFQPENEIAGLPEGRLQDTAVLDLIMKIQLENADADVTSCALFRDTSDLPEGDLYYSNIFDIYKFTNTLYRVTISGAELKTYMEWAAECYNTWQEGDINISFNKDKPGYLHDHFYGVDYEINLSKPAGQRIENVMFKGEPLQDDQELKLAVNDYRFNSGLKKYDLAAGDKEWESSNTIRDMIVAYLSENPTITPEIDSNWKITGVDLNKDDARRAEIISYINAGFLDTPYYESYNLADYDALIAQAKQHNVVVDGKPAVVAATADGYYRLRDLATACKGTSAAFNVDWNGTNVVIAKGGEYEADALAAVTGTPSGDKQTIAVLVDGKSVEVSTILVDGYNYVSVDGVKALLGVDAAQQDWFLKLGETAEIDFSH